MDAADMTMTATVGAREDEGGEGGEGEGGEGCFSIWHETFLCLYNTR